MLTDKAKKIFSLKYSINEKETWEQAVWRVTKHISIVEKKENRNKFEDAIFNLIYNKVFIPGGRVIANSGTGIKNLMNCFVLPIEDSRQSIYGTLQNAAEIFAHGGGVGFNFSNVREKNSLIKSTGGHASGPISFMSLYNHTGEVIQQASRRGAQLGCLNIDHPDIEDFINYKSEINETNKRFLSEYKENLILNDLNNDGNDYFEILKKTLRDNQLSHFNISINITDKFMNSYLKEDKFNLLSKVDKTIVKSIDAKHLFNLIAQRAWECGDPGILFPDRANEDNMVKYLGNLDATNPCSEIWLLPYEACCLGSLNLHSFYDEKTKGINFEFLEFAIRNAVRFLDNVQTLTELPIEEINTWSKGLRRLGLGVMGFADLLAELEIPYDSPAAIKLSSELSWFISFFGWLESISLAKEKGSFPFYNKDKVDLNVIEKSLNIKKKDINFNMQEIRNTGVRNTAVTAIAPTGSISILANVNSGIEPFFALAYKRNITEGIGNTAKNFLIELNPYLAKKLYLYGYKDNEIDEIQQEILENKTILKSNLVDDKIKSIFTNAHEISPYSHVNIQSAWQKYIDSSISKTINLSKDSTVDDVEKIFFYMWNKNLKGGTIYRDKSKSFQILNT